MNCKYCGVRLSVSDGDLPDVCDHCYVSPKPKKKINYVPTKPKKKKRIKIDKSILLFIVISLGVLGTWISLTLDLFSLFD